ncbi:hypothetical protein OHT59_40665 [Streptomyces sp. NBC_00243]|uniref:hypothetical protein n=1 Tax=Streptomyces sp. NBC_00243 TaxID=2975688 RepID=UPI002DD9BFDD|nr:hypothetical protein [Streptomyces sp. NBC_00243]WRZ24387.1 hypothetical protein OHT59_40665 [Streptomyces sp. NBC_00243]
MSKSTDVATGTIHLQDVGRVPAVEAQELTVGDQLMYNYGSVYQITKIEDASPKFLRINEVSAETGEEYQRRVKKTSLMARVPENRLSRLGLDAPTTSYRAQVRPPQGLDWITVSHGATVEDATTGHPAYFASSVLGSHGLGGHYDTTKASVKAMTEGKTLTAEDGHSFRILPPEQPEPTPSKTAATATLAEQYPVATPAVYVPEEGESYRDVVIVKSEPDANGNVDVISSRRNGETIRVALDRLQPLPELPPDPEGELTDWWTITDAQGNEIARAQGEDDPGARTAAMRQKSVRAAARRDKGFAVRRLRTSELSVPVGELRGLPRTAPAAPVDRWSVKDRQGDEIAQVEAASYDRAVRVANEDPKVRAAAPGAGGLVYMRLASTERPAPTSAHVTYGAFPDSLTVPQVDGAIRVLMLSRQPLAAFDIDTEKCVTPGAYLDPRRETGEVCLRYCGSEWDGFGRTTMFDAAAERVRREQIVTRYAELFRAAGWTIEEYRERAYQGDRERLVGLVLTPPANGN